MFLSSWRPSLQVKKICFQHVSFCPLVETHHHGGQVAGFLFVVGVFVRFVSCVDRFGSRCEEMKKNVVAGGSCDNFLSEQRMLRSQHNHPGLVLRCCSSRFWSSTVKRSEKSCVVFIVHLCVCGTNKTWIKRNTPTGAAATTCHKRQLYVSSSSEI